MMTLLRTTKYIHSKGVLHNDLKPENIFLVKKPGLTPDSLVIGDLGLANTIRHYKDNWDEAGTPGWMAPEANGTYTVHSPKTDVFSLGAILHFMVTGSPPFKSDLEKHRTWYGYGRIKDMLKLRGASDGLRTCILKMLEKDADARYCMDQALCDPWLLAASKPETLPQPQPTFSHHLSGATPAAMAASNVSKHAVNKPAVKTVFSPRKTRAGTRTGTQAAKTVPVPLMQHASKVVKRTAQMTIHTNRLLPSLATDDLENVDPNPQASRHGSNIPGPPKQSAVKASMLASNQAFSHPLPTSPHPHVSAASIARPTRLPSPPEKAPLSAEASRSNAAASPRPEAFSFASQDTSDAVLPQQDTAASAQAAGNGKPASALNRPRRLPKSLLAPALGAAAKRQGPASTVQALALRAPLQAHASAQAWTNASNPTFRQAAPKSRSFSSSANAAAALDPPAAREAGDTVKKVADPPAQAATIPVARRTRAARKELTLSSPPTHPPMPSSKPLSSTRPSSPPPSDSRCDSDRSSDGELGSANSGSANHGAANNGAANNGSANNGSANNGAANNGSANNGAAAVSQKSTGLRANSHKSIPVMLANPLYTRRCASAKATAGCKVDRAREKQAGTRQKRARSESDHPETFPHAAAHAIKHKKVRFTEPPNDVGGAPHTLSSAQQPQPPQQRSRVRSTRSRADPTRRQPPTKKPTASALDQQQCVPAAQDSNAGEGHQTAQPSIAARTRSASKAHIIAPQKELTASVPDEADQCCESNKQRHSIAARTRAAGTFTKWTCNNSHKNKRQSTANAAVTRSASTAAAATTGQSKRKQPATAGPDEEEWCPVAKRVRAGKTSAEVATTGSTAPRSGTAARQTRERQDKPVKRNQRPARAASVLAKDCIAGLNKMH